MVNMWMVRAGKNAILIDEFEKLNIVAIGWGLGDLTNKTPDEIKDLVYEKYPKVSNITKGKFAANEIKFCHDIEKGDYVLSYNSLNHNYLFGKIASNYYYNPSLVNEEYSDVRDVEWICIIPRDNLKKSTQNTLGALMTVFKIKGDAKEDILNFFNGNDDSIDKSAIIIRKYLDEKNLVNFKNEGNEQAYIKFKELFSPEILKNLEGMDILNTIFLHDGDKNNLCYNLEFSKDYTFAGSISGGSAHKYSLFKHNETHQWTAGSPKKSNNVSEDEAIEIGGKIRDALVNGANLIKNSNLIDVNDYIQLENNLGDIFSDCTTSHLNQWVHKYFALIFPDKFPVVHWEAMKKDFLKKFNISPEEWYYALDGQLVLLSKKADIKGYSLFKDEILNLFENKPKPHFECNLKRNIIYFGAPGTGKSYNLNQDKEKLLENYEGNYERVTFHPDYSYANFVGTYKPVPKGESITYKYVPGPFMRIFKKATEHPNEPYLLIIEEINRANVAAVFGDVFQLLDRNKNYESVYPIDATEDMKTYLNRDKIILPNNLFIWATMNSADQGVFPMDTAFKRRWDFKYFSINHNEDLIENINVNLNGISVNWNLFRKAINDELLSYKINEDKLMGPFFAFNEFKDKNLDEDTFKDIFKNKIIMYLYEDAARSKRNDLFSGAKSKNYVTYSEICNKFDEIGIGIFCDSIKSKFERFDYEE